MGFIANTLENNLEVSRKKAVVVEAVVMLISIVTIVIFSEFFMALSIYVMLLFPFLVALSYLVDTFLNDCRALGNA